MGRSQEFHEFQHGTVIGSHLCNNEAYSAQRSPTFSSHSLQISKLYLNFRLAQEQFVESLMEWKNDRKFP